MLKNELETKIVRVNWDFILNNFTNEKFWEQTWRIFEYDGLVLELSLMHIDVESGKIVIKIKSRDLEGEMISYQSGYIRLPIGVANRNIEVFNKLLYTAVMESIGYAECGKLIRTSDRYNELFEVDCRAKEELKDIAKKQLDEFGITEGYLRDAYITAYVDENEPWLRTKFLTQSKYISKPSWYLMASIVFGTSENQDEIRDNINQGEDIISTLEKDIEEFKENLENGNWVVDMENLLPEI